MLIAFNISYILINVIYVRCEEMADWTTHRFTGGQDEQGRFKGKGELQLKEVGKAKIRKVKVVIMMMMKVKVMMIMR